ncbi:MAG: hypothetical protein ACLPV4_14090 [Solirubrobacteraceae bacterium]
MHVWFIIRWLHLLAMAFFVGGQLVLAVAVVPVLRHAPESGELRAVARRFGVGTLVAFAVLLVTGTAMASHLDLWGDRTLQVKLALAVVVAALLLWHVRRPTLHILEAVIFLLSLAIVWLGLYLANGYS